MLERKEEAIGDGRTKLQRVPFNDPNNFCIRAPGSTLQKDPFK